VGIKHDFSIEKTPLQFRSYLTISVSEYFVTPTILDNQFWVSQVIQTTVEPVSLPNKSQDQFYLDEGTSFGKFMIG